MSDGKKDSGKSISRTKLSAAVPEFVPSGIAHNTLTSSSNLHIRSSLSALVPEFQPSVLSTDASPMTSPRHSEKPINSNLSPLPPEFCSSGSPTSTPSSLCETKQSFQQNGKFARVQNKQNCAWESDTNNTSDKTSVKQSQKKGQKKNKKFEKSIAQGENASLAGYPLIRNQSPSNKAQQEISADKIKEDVKSKAISGLQQNCLLSPPHSSNDETSASDNSLKGRFNAVHVASNTKPYVAPTLVESYSDKLKSQPPKQNVTSNHLDTKKAWRTNLTAESFSRKSKQEEMEKPPKYHDSRSKSNNTVNSDKEKNLAKKGKRDNDYLETRWQESKYDKLKYGCTTKLQSANTNQVNRNIRYQKADDDDNWRKKDFDGFHVDVVLSKEFEDKIDIVSPKASPAALSYSAALQSSPIPKVISAWEKKQPITPKPGILKVQPPLAINEVENGASQDGSSQVKNLKRKKKKTVVTGEQVKDINTNIKRTQRPIYLDWNMMQIPSEAKAQKNSKRKTILLSSSSMAYPVNHLVKRSSTNKAEVRKIPLNALDATAPLVKRGKERESPSRKKPSRVKRIILKEREEKKKARETTEADNTDQSWDDNQIDVTCEVDAEAKDVIPEEISENLSEEETAQGVSGKLPSPTDDEIAAQIHSRRFREYCSQIPDKEVDLVTIELLKALVRFQDKQFHKDPTKAKQKRRLVLGLREVTKHLKLRKLKCVIISSNVERIRSEGGLDETLSSIIALCQENQVHLVFALKRQRLGKVLLKKVPVSIVGIFNYNGADDHYNKLIELTQRTKQAYTEKWEETREKLESQQLPGTNMNDLENNQSCEADNTIDSVAENSDDDDDDEKVGGDNDSGSANEDRITGNDLTIEDV